MSSSIVTVELAQLNKYLICKVCQDYFIHAVTINECLHTFCKTCLTKCIQIKNCCPECKADLGINAFQHKIIFDRNIQALVDKILPEHAAEAADKELKKENIQIDILSILAKDSIQDEPVNAKQPTVVEAEEEEPYEVCVRVTPFLASDNGAFRTSLELPPLQKPLLKMKSTVFVYKLAKFVYKRLSDQGIDISSDQIEILSGGRVVSRSRIFGSLTDKDSNSISSPLNLSFRKKLTN